MLRFTLYHYEGPDMQGLSRATTLSGTDRGHGVLGISLKDSHLPGMHPNLWICLPAPSLSKYMKTWTKKYWLHSSISFPIALAASPYVQIFNGLIIPSLKWHLYSLLKASFVLRAACLQAGQGLDWYSICLCPSHRHPPTPILLEQSWRTTGNTIGLPEWTNSIGVHARHP